VQVRDLRDSIVHLIKVSLSGVVRMTHFRARVRSLLLQKGGSGVDVQL
jgi:hypothetical protein